MRTLWDTPLEARPDPSLARLHRPFEPRPGLNDSSVSRLNERVRGKRGVTADTALRLAQFFKTSPRFWMHLQANFDLKVAMVRRRALTLAQRS
jgi:hypothetical protein